jgi:hypothetical protein
VSEVFAPKLRSRAYFSTYHLWASRSFAKKCLSLESSHTGGSHFDIEHRALSMAAIVEAGAFLEALINELFADCHEGYTQHVVALDPARVTAIGNQWHTWHSPKRRTVATLEKFDIALQLCGLPSFNHGTAPYQDADTALALRNALMHATPEWVGADEAHRFDALKTKFPQNSKMAASGNAFFPDKCLGAGCAQWVIESVFTYANAFCSRLSFTAHYMRQPFPAP